MSDFLACGLNVLCIKYYWIVVKCTNATDNLNARMLHAIDEVDMSVLSRLNSNPCRSFSYLDYVVLSSV